jgi:hypothetical protein
VFFYAVGGDFFIAFRVKKIADIVGHFDKYFNFHGAVK